MQYPQIQFYRGSLVRLGSGRLKQVEDLSSDDFLESARFISGAGGSGSRFNSHSSFSSRAGSGQAATTGSSSTNSGSKHSIDENNNSVFSSPQPTSSSESPNFDLMEIGDDDQDDEDDDEELDVVSDEPKCLEREPDIRIESSVVRDFLEVGTGSCSPGSRDSPFASTSTMGLVSPQPTSNNTICSSVLVKFFLESSRTVVFTEVPAEHPFFVFHRGWSSWNPQRTFDKFGLKCRKLKIGDTCISLIRQSNNRKSSVNQQDSDQCNFLFSSINISE